ncbi:MAG: potassium channel family protein [Baekduia sp.]
MTTPTNPFDRLDPAERRRVATHAAARITAVLAGLGLIYALIPLPDRPTTGSIIGLVAGLAAFVTLIVWQLRSIISSTHPGVRAIEAVSAVIGTLVVVFAYTYAGLSASNPDAFNEAVGRIDGIYLSVTTLSTVGFGDIVARTDTARLIVTGQIIIDLIVVVGVVRLLMAAAKRDRT